MSCEDPTDDDKAVMNGAPSMRGGPPAVTPAMEAGIAGHVWSIEEVVGAAKVGIPCLQWITRMTKGKYKRKRERAQKRAQEKSAAPNPSLNQAVEAEHKGNATNTSHSNGDKKKEVSMSLRQVAKRSSFSDWCLVAFTLALAVLGYLQFKTMDSQLNVMRNDERAWLEMKDVASDPKAIQIISGQGVIWPLKIANIGKTPAKNIQMRISVEVLGASQSPNFQCVEENLPYSCSRNAFEIGIIYPNSDSLTIGDRVADRGGEQTASAAEAAAWDSGDDYMIVYGIAAYDDVFHTHHWMKFCFWQTKPGYSQRIYQSRSCTDYNSVDQN